MMFTEVASLPFRKIYSVDFEYCGADGEIPKNRLYGYRRSPVRRNKQILA